MTEEQARSDYARHFVREHFLRKDFEKINKAYTERMRHDYFMAQAQRGLSLGDCGWCSFDGRKTKTDKIKTDYFANLTDLEADPPPAQWVDEWWFGRIRMHYQVIRTAEELCRTTEWLLAEAEYQRVFHEALVRSYGVDVTPP